MGFALLGFGEVLRESSLGPMSNAAVLRLLVFIAATGCILVAWAMNVGVIPS